ncbi:MAG: glycosyltransferase [Caulobacter sp.]|nr:glycosyltransferase [Caulobacter sp.]
MRITIVTPALDCASTIGPAIESVLSQDAEVEYIVIDGGSSDETMSVVRRYASRLADVVSEKDGGPYEAVMRGFSRSTGDVMGWLGADDMLLPGALMSVTRIFETFPQVEWLTTLRPAFRFDGMLSSGNLPGVSREALLDGIFGPLDEPVFVSALQQESTFWRRGLWERAGATLDTNYRFAADFALWMRFSRHAEPYGSNLMLGAFTYRTGQISQRHRERYSTESIEILERERRLSSWTPRPFEPSGLKTYRGRYVILDHCRLALYDEPFFVVDPEKKGLKTMLSRTVIR